MRIRWRKRMTTTGQEHLTSWMREVGWLQPKLAGALNVSQTTVSRWLAEDGSVPEQPQRVALATLTRLPIDRVPWNVDEAEKTSAVVASAREARPRIRRAVGA